MESDIDENEERNSYESFMLNVASRIRDGKPYGQVSRELKRRLPVRIQNFGYNDI